MSMVINGLRTEDLEVALLRALVDTIQGTVVSRQIHRHPHLTSQEVRRRFWAHIEEHCSLEEKQNEPK